MKKIYKIRGHHIGPFVGLVELKLKVNPIYDKEEDYINFLSSTGKYTKNDAKGFLNLAEKILKDKGSSKLKITTAEDEICDVCKSHKDSCSKLESEDEETIKEYNIDKDKEYTIDELITIAREYRKKKGYIFNKKR
ncbi:MAG: DUF1284 domain-containing protein [Candidatus Nanoarchaeia archaeon]|nr:DUF1284 domain-containing protein [Candidatus Nanoarchaeia archaeon]